MKKKPELFKRTGKSSLTLRNFLNNLKENDLHYENKQITQCVFLGVLRLKPVPSIFSKNNVPSVSAPVENKPKRIKNNNSNKEHNKNVSKKSDINKVIAGKVSKKDPQKVKAAVKKVPDKKSTFKIKLQTNKKTSKVKKNLNPSTKDGQKAVTDSPESSQAIACDPVLSTPAIGLTPLGSPTKFNPVQNLFDKLKQKIDSSHSEPGPSTVPKQTNKTVDGPGPSGEHSKVCKINAKRQIIPTVNANKKSKKASQKKPVNNERLSMPLKPTSPITISDNDSNGKKDDVIIIDENNFLNGQDVVEEVNVEKGTTEDIIFINEDPKPVKQKERTSPRNKTVISQDKETSTDNFEKHGVVIINDEQKSTKVKRRSPPKSSESVPEVAEARRKNQSSDIIVISDEPKATRSTANKTYNNTVEKDNGCKVQEGSKNNVIIIDEIREFRVSPRMRNMEALQSKSKEVQSSNTNLQEQETVGNDVIVISEEANTSTVNKTHTAQDIIENFSEKSATDNSKMQELNITIDNHQNIKNKDETSSRLLKMVDNADKNISVAVKKELIEAEVIVVNEKPKQRKPRLKSALIPPMFLNAPMLLRSELAPKKTTPGMNCEKPKRKERSTTKLLRSDMGHTKNLKHSPVNVNDKNSPSAESEITNSKPQNKYSKFLRPGSSNKRKSENSVSLLGNSQTNSGSEDIIFVEDHTKKSHEKYSNRILKSGRPEKSSEKMQEIDLVTEVEKFPPDSLHKSDILEITTPNPPHSNVQESEEKDDVIILNEKPVKEQIQAEKQSTSTRLLRSELAHKKSPETSLKKSKENKEHVTKPRQRSSKNIPEVSDEDDVIIKEEIKPTEKISPRLLRSDLAKQKIPENSQTEDKASPIKNEEKVEKGSPRQKVTEISPQKDDLSNSINEVEIMDPQKDLGTMEISDPQEDLGSRTLTSGNHSDIHCVEQSVGEIEDDVMIVKEEPKSKKASPRTLRSDITEVIQVESPEPNKINKQEILVINDDKVPPQKEKTSPRLLRSEIAQQKTRTKSPQKNKQIDLDEIIVVTEKRVKKTKEKPVSGRLLRSELALQKTRELLQVKKEVEEVVVLIHDEPKPKHFSPRNESPQKNNDKNNIQEEVIVVAEEPQPSKVSPRSLRSDTSQKVSPAKTPPKTEYSSSDDIQENTKAENRRLLRSEQNEESRSPVEAKVEQQKMIRSDIASVISLQGVSKDLERSEAAEEQMQKQTPTTRSHKSIEAQHSPENVAIEVSKNLSSTNSEKKKPQRSETRKSPRAQDQPGSSDVVEVNVVEQLTSQSKMLKSQQSPRNLLEESAGLVERQNLLISDISKKTAMTMPVEQSGNVTEQMENVSTPRLLRSIASKSLPEQSDTPIKKKVRKRLLKSEITPSKLCSDGSIDVDLSTTNDTNKDITDNDKSYSRRALRSDNASVESSENQLKEQPADAPTTGNTPPKEQLDTIEIIDNAGVKKQNSPRLLRSEMSSQKSPTILLEQPESIEPVAEISGSDITSRKSLPELPQKETKAKRGRPRKTQSLLIDSKTKPKTPMLLRSELAQLNNVNADAPNQEQEVKKQKKRGRKPKVTSPPSNVEVPVQEISPKVQASDNKGPKRKSLIDDLKRKNYPKQKAVTVQNLKSSPEKISEPKTMSQELSEIKIVNNENNTENVPNILPSSIPVEVKTEENSTETILKCNSKVQDVPKGVKTKKKVKGNSPVALTDKSKVQDDPKTSIKEGLAEEPTERLVKCMSKVQGVTFNIDIEITSEGDNFTEYPLKTTSEAVDPAPKSIKPKKKVEGTSVKNPLKRRSNSQDPPKNVKPRLSKNNDTSTKLTSITAKSSPEVVDLQASEKTSPRQYKKRLSAKRKLKVSNAVESDTSPKEPAPQENMLEEVKVNKTPEKPPKQFDTTVFDFVETEPEVVPLRLSSPKRNRKFAPENGKESKASKHTVDVTPKPKKPKLMANKSNTDDPKTKAQAKAKLLAMFGDKSPQKDNLESPEKPKGKSTKAKCASKTKTDKKQSLALPLPSPKQAGNTRKGKKIPAADKTNTSPLKTATSPMKQTTITDMFNKVLVKKEKAESEFDAVPKDTPPEEPLKETTNENTDMTPPKIEKTLPLVKNEEEEENGVYDDDSDCESRAEWMPEEYAEYKFKYSAKKMMNTFTKPIVYKCKICLLILPSYYRLVKHKKQHVKTPNPYNCPQCVEAFPTIEDLTAHLRVHKGKHPYACSKCDLGFFTKKELDEHTPIHVLRKIKQPNKRFRCDVCAKEFSKLCDMERHTRVHTGEKPCVCNICDKRFQQSHNLSKHLLTHLHVKPYHCEICNKQFGRNDVLNRHLLTHSVEKPIKCPLCSKGFIRQTQLNNHMTSRHLDASRIDTAVETIDVETTETKVEADAD